MDVRRLVFVMTVAMLAACTESYIRQGERESERGGYSWTRWTKEHVMEVLGFKQGLDIVDVTKPAPQIVKGMVSLGGTANKAFKKANDKLLEAKGKTYEPTSEDATTDKASVMKDAAIAGVQTMKSKAHDYSTAASNKASQVKDQAQQQAETIAEGAKKGAQAMKNKAQEQTQGASEKASKIKEQAQQEVKMAAQKTKETLDHKVKEVKESASSNAQDDAKETVEERSSWVKEKAKEGYNVAKEGASNSLHYAKEKVKNKVKEKAIEMKEKVEEMVAPRYSDSGFYNEL